MRLACFVFVLAAVFFNAAGYGMRIPFTCTGPSSINCIKNSSEDLLQKIAARLKGVERISYNYELELSYSSEGYHNIVKGKTFIDFKSNDTIIGFKYQWQNEASSMIFNGAESFSLNKKNKTIA